MMPASMAQRRRRRSKRRTGGGLNNIVEEHHRIAHRTVYVAPKEYEMKVIRDIREIDNPLDTSHPLVAAPVKELAEKLVVKKDGGISIEDTLVNALKWVSENIRYDDIHANASIMWRYNMNLNYMTAKEALELRRGICGEQSLVLLAILRNMGIPSVLVRPSVSHLAVLAYIPSTGKYYLLDTVSKQATEIPRVDALKRYVSPSGKYVIGPISLDEFAKQTVLRRKKIGYGAGVTDPREAIDIEYALHCIETLPYGTERGKKLLDYLVRTGYCKRLFSTDPIDIALSTHFFAEAVMECGKIPLRKMLAGRPTRYTLCIASKWDTEYPRIMSKIYGAIQAGEDIW